MRPEFTISQDFVAISGRRPVRAMLLDVPDAVRPHDHEFAEICYVASGEGVHVTADGSTPMKPGDAFLALPGQVHAIKPVRRLEVWNVYYLADWFLRDVQEYRNDSRVLALFFAGELFDLPVERPALRLGPKVSARRAILAELGDIAAEGARDDPSPLFLTACFNKLMHHLANAATDGDLAAPATLREDVWRVMLRVEELLGNGRRYDAEAIAAQAPVGADRLARTFKAHTGLTPFAYYQRRRLQLARKLLLDPTRTLTDVALTLGFADASHFGREFRAFYSTTPRSFRAAFLHPSAVGEN